MQVPVTVLNANTKRETGKKAQDGNIAAAKVGVLLLLDTPDTFDHSRRSSTSACAPCSVVMHAVCKHLQIIITYCKNHHPHVLQLLSVGS
jgi:hypothetical protein